MKGTVELPNNRKRNKSLAETDIHAGEMLSKREMFQGPSSTPTQNKYWGGESQYFYKLQYVLNRQLKIVSGYFLSPPMQTYNIIPSNIVLASYNEVQQPRYETQGKYQGQIST